MAQPSAAQPAGTHVFIQTVQRLGYQSGIGEVLLYPSKLEPGTSLPPGLPDHYVWQFELSPRHQVLRRHSTAFSHYLLCEADTPILKLRLLSRVLTL
jgi:hypothetical protein